MSNLLNTKALEKYVSSIYSKIIPLMKNDDVYIPLNTVFNKNTLRDTQGEFCFTEDDGYHFRVLDRGSLYRDDMTQSLFEITYWAIKSEISEASAIYEAQNRVLGQDFRRIMFTRRLQYFEAIGPEFAQRALSEIEVILKRAPFQD